MKKISRKKKIIAASGAGILVAGTAFGVYLNFAKISGSANISTMAPTINTMTKISEVDMQCTTGAAAGAGTVAIGATFGQSSCDMRAVVGLPTGNAGGYVYGVETAGLPSGYTLDILSGCGAEVTAGAGGTQTVDLRLSLDNTAVSGTWSGDAVGVVLVPTTQTSQASATAACQGA